MGRKKSSSLCVPMREILPLNLCEKLENLAKSQLEPDTIPYLSPAEKALDDMHTEKWGIICLWIAYKRYPCIDIGRSPFNIPRVQLWKRFAFQMNAQLNLIQNTFDVARGYPNRFEKIKRYETPINYWFHCMTEYRNPFIRKELKERGITQFKNHLTIIKRRGNVETTPPNPINDALFNLAISLASEHKEISLSLDEYCYWLGEFLSKDAKKLSCFWIEGNKLLTRNQKQPRGFSPLHQSTLEELKVSSRHLSIITHKPWNDQPVYIRESSEISSKL
jgi:hypothetical protein